MWPLISLIFPSNLIKVYSANELLWTIRWVTWPSQLPCRYSESLIAACCQRVQSTFLFGHQGFLFRLYSSDVTGTVSKQDPAPCNHGTSDIMGPSLLFLKDLTNLMDDVLPELLRLQTSSNKGIKCECRFFMVFLMISVHWSVWKPDGAWELKTSDWISNEYRAEVSRWWWEK